MKIIESKNFELISGLIEEVQNLHAGLFPDVYKPFQKDEIGKMMTQMFSEEQCRVFVAQEEGVAVGYIMVLINVVQENAFHYAYKLLHIDQIVVSKHYQKTGMGSLLIEKAEALATELGIDRIELDHLFVNDTAAKFFKGKGFNPYREKLFKTIDSK